MKIYNLGSMNIDYVYSVDHFVAAGETLSSAHREVFPGGKGLNQSIALARAGAPVIHGGILGENGGFLKDTMAASGVDVSRIQTVDGSCGHAIIQVDRAGQNCILLFSGTNHCLTKSYVEEFLSDAQPEDLLLLQNETNGLDMIFEVAHQRQMQIAFNPSPFHSDIKRLPFADVTWWFCNEIEGEALFGSSDPQEILRRFGEQYPNSHLILTLGKRGSLFGSANRMIEQPIYKANTVDTTAAGDTFTGYFLASIARGEDVAEALNIAAKAAAITVSKKGAAESIPYLACVK